MLRRRPFEKDGKKNTNTLTVKASTLILMSMGAVMVTEKPCEQLTHRGRLKMVTRAQHLNGEPNHLLHHR